MKKQTLQELWLTGKYPTDKGDTGALTNNVVEHRYLPFYDMLLAKYRDGGSGSHLFFYIIDLQ